MRVVVHSAAIQDRDGAGLVLDKIRRRFPWLELIWADGGYSAWQVDVAVAKVPRLHLAIVKRSDDVKGFVVLSRRWVVERTFSWFGRNRRLAKDFENLAETLAILSPSLQSSLPSGGSPGRSPDAGRYDRAGPGFRSGRFRIGQPTFAGASSNDADAPIAVIAQSLFRRRISDPERTSRDILM